MAARGRKASPVPRALTPTPTPCWVTHTGHTALLLTPGPSASCPQRPEDHLQRIKSSRLTNSVSRSQWRRGRGEEERLHCF